VLETENNKNPLLKLSEVLYNQTIKRTNIQFFIIQD